MSHFIATMIYNNVSIYYIKDRENFETFLENEKTGLCSSLCKKGASYNEISLKARFIKEMLFYRLISTADILNLSKNLLKRIENQKCIEEGNEP